MMLLLTAVGCGAADRQRATILVSGDTAGWITPCGCTANQSGGLARRATLLSRETQNADVLYLDAGGSASGAGEYQRMKFAAILRGLAATNVAAHNIGGPETAMMPEQLAALRDETGITFLSANVRPKEGESAAKIVIVTERAGLRIAITGVVDPAFVTNSSWTARESTSAVLSAFANVKADVRVVLAYFDEAGLRSLADALPEVDYVIGGPTGQVLNPVKNGPVTVMSATNKGKFLARIELTRVRDGKLHQTSVGPVEVKSELAEDVAQTENLRRFYRSLATRDFTAEEAGLSGAAGIGGDDYRIAGSARCASCHADDNTLWIRSKHDHAWEALTVRGAHVDPFCQQCHTTGYGLPGGFVSAGRSGQQENVGCENCHGPSAAHAADPRRKTPFRAAQQCVRCHDSENSPQFVYEDYWPKVRHGTKLSDSAKESPDGSKRVP